jgi:hypothetical protein
MVTPPPDATRTRALLTALTAPLPQEVPAEWSADLRPVVERIRSELAKADHAGHQTIPFAVLLAWRTGLDTALVAAEHADEDLWTRWRQPATWLDSLLRLRSVISHVVGKAYWDDLETVRYVDIDIERYLGGAR